MIKMKYNAEKHHRRSIRLQNYDYSQAGLYFITICTYHAECLLSRVIDGRTYLNKYGAIVENEWLKTGEMRDNVELDAYIIMPNHLHGVILLAERCRGTMHRAPTKPSPKHESFGKPVSGSIPTIIRGFKSIVTKKIHKLRSSTGVPVWQRNYYEHIIRSENKLQRIREYIISNPVQWETDIENPDSINKITVKEYYGFVAAKKKNA